MAKKRRTVFGDAASAAKNAPAVESTRQSNMVGQRHAHSAEISNREKVQTQKLLVDPSDCVVWEKHNRKFDRLNPYSCRELIEAFRAAGRQEIPAIVRRRPVKTGPKYEVIAGARRLWVVRYLREHGLPDLKYLVEVHDDLDDDRTAFKKMDLENRGRSAPSSFEQGMSYKQMLETIANGNQGQLAEFLGVSASKISRCLKIAEIPESVLAAFAELKDVGQHNAPKIISALEKGGRARAALLAEADVIAAEQRDLLDAGKAPHGGAKVTSRLLAATDKRKRPKGPVASFGPSAKPHLELRNKNAQGLTIYIPHARGASVEELQSHFSRLLEEHHQKG